MNPVCLSKVWLDWERPFPQVVGGIMATASFGFLPPHTCVILYSPWAYPSLGCLKKLGCVPVLLLVVPPVQLSISTILLGVTAQPQMSWEEVSEDPAFNLMISLCHCLWLKQVTKLVLSISTTTTGPMTELCQSDVQAEKTELNNPRSQSPVGLPSSSSCQPSVKLTSLPLLIHQSWSVFCQVKNSHHLSELLVLALQDLCLLLLSWLHWFLLKKALGGNKERGFAVTLKMPLMSPPVMLTIVGRP